MRKITKVLTAVALASVVLTGCGKSADSAGFDTSKEISVISREDGSGTRGAFIEIFGVEEKDAEGNKVDKTTTEANITNNTSVMMTSVAGDVYAIGYISLGSLNDTVKAAKIDGVEATVENIKSGTYKISRPFYIATKGDLNELTSDFIQYIMSKEGQAIVTESGYIGSDTTESYAGNSPSGKITVAGSSSVTPVMEKLKEAYKKINANAEIEIQQSDSSTGMSSVNEGICDIGMASRELKESELENGINGTVIATDGIAVILNKDNTTDSLTVDQVKSIYVGDATLWSDVVTK